MSNTICGQTLVLVDNDGTVSEVNQKIIKATLKYMIYHKPDNRAFCINTYEHVLTDEESYTTDINDLLCKADLMEFKAKDSNLSDVIARVLTDWKEADFACRDILVFTDGLEGVSTEFEDEELFYLIENTSFPIYIVDLVQEDNASAKKHLSALATTSEGKLFMTEFEGSDADVDKQLSDGIYAAMDEYAKANWAQYEDNAEEANVSEGNDTAACDEDGGAQLMSDEAAGPEEKAGEENWTDEAAADGMGEEAERVEEYYNDEYFAEPGDALEAGSETSVLYESRQEGTFISTPFGVAVILAGTVVLVLAAIFSSLAVIRKKKNKALEDGKIDEIIEKETAKKDGFCGDDFLMDEMGMTMLLDDNSTVLLGNGSGTGILNDTLSRKIELISDSDGGENLNISLVDKVVLGRSQEQSDVCIRDDSVSKRHVMLSLEDGKVYAEDLDSSNGTYVNGSRIDKCILNDKDLMRLGRKKYRVKIDE